MNAIVYCRVSSKEQVAGTSLHSQRQACEDYAKHHRITIQRVFVEEGESAKFADRTQLAELLSFCRDHQKSIDMLLVWKLDRFARNVSDHFSIKAALLKHGVRVVSVTEPIDTNPEGRLMETILAGFAQFDNDIRALRTVQGMKRKLQEGIWPFHPPLGYEACKAAGEKKTSPDQPKQPIFGQLQRAWRAFATGTYTKAEIRRLMKSWGIVDASGQAYSPQAIDRLFANPYYAGILVNPWTKERHPGHHIPLVTLEEFERVQTVTQRRSHSASHTSIHPTFPLRGVVRCPGCSHLLTGGLSRGRSRLYPYYSCRVASCPRKNFVAQQVHAEFERLLDRVRIRESLLPVLIEALRAASEQREQHATEVRALITAKRAELDRQVKALIEMRTNSLLTDTEFLDQKSVLTRRQALLEADAVRRTASVRELASRLESVILPLSNLRQTWNALQPADRQRFNRMFFGVGFQVGSCRTAEIPLLFSVFEHSATRNLQEVPLSDEKLNQLEAEIMQFSEFFASVVLPAKLSETRFNDSSEGRPQRSTLNQDRDDDSPSASQEAR